MKKIRVTIIMLGLLFSLFGCGDRNTNSVADKSAKESATLHTTKYANKVTDQNAAKIMETLLAEKYGADFSVSGVTQSSRSDIFSKTCYVASATDAMGQKFSVRLYGEDGSITDQYTMILFGEQVEELVTSVLAGKSYITGQNLDFYYEYSAQKWNAQATLEDYLEAEECKVNGTIFIEAIDEEEFVENIYDLVQTFEDEKIPFALSFEGEKHKVFLGNGSNVAAITKDTIRQLL
ncbi:MAG: hypothetical protein Q4B72_09570 [Lachnospiraceae bacterium]|nr:hypothetical protein [Lachnospiraceae bacterium]